jgi:hypothetical protein
MKGVQRATPFAGCEVLHKAERLPEMKGVQRATPFAGVWGVPTHSSLLAAAGGKAEGRYTKLLNLADNNNQKTSCATFTRRALDV